MHKTENKIQGKGNARYRLTPDEVDALTRYRLQTDDFIDLPEWLVTMPDGKDEVDEHIVIEGNTAIICDVHLGFHDIEAIKACIQHMRKMKVDNIVNYLYICYIFEV